MPKPGFVYILANKRNGTLYIGATSDLARRVEEHKLDVVEGFTKRYQIHTLVYYEAHEDIRDAIERERQLKKWERKWKLRLIEELNPKLVDLSEGLL
jgi:putative endonuclease